MKTFNQTFVFFIFLFLVACNRNGNYNDYGSSYYEPETKTVYGEEVILSIGKLYYVASPAYYTNNWKQLNNLVANNRNLLRSNSPIIKCMKEVGENMQIEAMQSFDSRAGINAYASAISYGANASQARQIQTNIENGQIQPYLIGKELVWLSQVLPKAAQGDWSGFMNTGTFTRRQAIEGIALIQQMFEYMGETEMLNYVMSTMNEYQPYLEYQTAVMISWFI